jgi:cardiolipin synthase
MLPVLPVGEVGLWLAAALTLYTGYDYLATGLRHVDEDASPAPAKPAAPARQSV